MGIVDFVSMESGPDRAAMVLDRLLAAARRLAETPGMGHRREHLTSGDLRFWSVLGWLIVYDPRTDPLEIVRVLHGARGPNALRSELER